MIAEFRTMELTFKRTIPASPPEVYDAWLDTTKPGSPWHDADKLIFDPKPAGLYYFRHEFKEGPRPHFGRFAVLDRPRKIQFTWMSLHTHGLESVVTVTCEPQGPDTVFTLNHANLPDDEHGRLHEKGWGYFLGLFAERFIAERA